MKTKHLSLFLFIFLISAHFSYAYSQDPFKRLLEKFDKRFQEFVDEKDRQFAEFLKKAWSEFDIQSGMVKDQTPKPVTPPVFEPPEEKKQEDDIIRETKPPKEKPVKMPEIPEKDKEYEKPVVKKLPDKKKVPDFPKIDVMEDMLNPEENMESTSMPFFGTTLEFKYQKSETPVLEAPIDNEKISNYWKIMSLMDYKNILEHAQIDREQMNLNDWGYYLLLKDVTDTVFDVPENEKLLIRWFLLLKSGYDAKIGYNKNDIFLMLPFNDTVFELKFIAVNGKKYYTVSLLEKPKVLKSIRTYKGNYPEAEKQVDLGIYDIPKLGERTIRKELSFSYRGMEYSVTLSVNNNVVDFYATYPPTELPLYFRAAVSPESEQSLKNSLKAFIGDKTESAAVNFLLHFVQKAFAYQIDQEQFGKEKTLFVEESLFYPYCDCEDRSVLFAYLVRELTGLEVIGIEYPGHLATAVRFNDDVSGDSVFYNGEKYVICDPTFINAEVGSSMERFKGVKPNVIDFVRN